MVKTNFIILVILFSFFTKAFCQNQNDSASVNKEFNTALDLYNTSKYQDAQIIFNKIAFDYQFNPKTTLSYLFDGKALLALKQFEQAEKVLNTLLDDYSSSNYSDEAMATLSKVFYEKGDYYSTFKELTILIEKTGSPVYSSYAKTTGEKISGNYLSVPQVIGLYDSTSNQKLKPYLMLLIGKMYMDKSAFGKAEVIFSKLLKDFPNSEEKSEAVTLYQHIVNEKHINPEAPVIGVMLPLSHVDGDALNATTEMLEGIKFAVDKYNKEHDLKIGLIIRDTERKNSKISEIKKEFENIPTLRAIIGPVFSDEVRDALKEFSSTDIPIISPTATDNDLTELDQNFFQANPSFDIRGKVMADYIYYVENKRKMAVLNAVEGYSPLLADAFVKEFEKLGGQIINRQTYNSNKTEYNDQVSKIAADSLSIEGVYLPLADKRDVPALLSNFAQHNLDLPIYGNQDWFLAKGYETYPSLSNKLTFTSDYFIDYSDTTLQYFSKSFFNQTNIDVDRNVLYGYDITNYLLSIIPSSPDRTVLKSNIESEIIFKGLHNNFYFDQSRVNKFINIIRYKDGKFQLIDKFKAGK